MSCGGLQVRSISRTRDSMSCKSASNAVALIGVAVMIVVLLLLVSRSFGSALSMKMYPMIQDLNSKQELRCLQSSGGTRIIS